MSLPALLLLGAVVAGSRKLLQYLEGPEATEPRDPPAEVEGADATRPIEPAPAAPDTEPAQAARPDGSAEREVNNALISSTCGLTLALAGSCIPRWSRWLLPASSAVTLYSSLPLFRRAYRAVTEEKRLRASLLDSLAVLTAQLGGFFVVSAIGSLIYNIGCKLLLKTEDRSRGELGALFETQQRTVWLLHEGSEIETPLAGLRRGSLIVVQAGQVVPVDGVIRAGSACIDQHMLTGESLPADKGEGERVLASTLVLSGRLIVEVEHTGADTMIARIGKLLSATADYRTELVQRSERIGDKVVLPLLALSGLALVTVGGEGAIIMLGCNFADNLRVASPLAMLNFLNLAARRSILIKDGRALEALHGIDTIVFDKTGTLTLEQPVVGEIHVCGQYDREQLLAWAAVAEARQTHPIARAIVQKASELALSLPGLDGVRYEVGYGVAAGIEGHRVQVGSARFMARSGITIPHAMAALEARLHEQGSSLVFVAVDGSLAGGLELSPSVHPELLKVLDTLRRRGLRLCILSGDHEAPTRWLATQLGIESYHAEVLPADKAAVVRSLQKEGRRVCFVGDGINDAIALKSADLSISLRGGSTAATDTAQIVLLGGNLQPLPALFSLSDEYERNARTGLALSVGVGALCAASVFLFNIQLLTAILLYNLSFVASVANAMLPRLRTRSDDALIPDRGALHPDPGSGLPLMEGAASIPCEQPRITA